jgi:uncharacterized protein YqhQ
MAAIGAQAVVEGVVAPGRAVGVAVSVPRLRVRSGAAHGR